MTTDDSPLDPQEVDAMRTGTLYRAIPGPKRNITQESRRAAAEPAPATLSEIAPEEAELRFWRRYGPALLASLLGGEPVTLPTTTEGWLELARSVRTILQAQELARAQIGELSS